MSGPDQRRVIPHAAIGLSLCIGAYSFFVEPIHKRLAETRAKEAHCEAELRPAQGLRDGVPAMTAALEKAQREAATIRDLGRPARDERDLFASVTALAEACRVQIDQLVPTKVVQPALLHDPAAATATPSRDAAAGYSITVLCSYQNLASFLHEIRSELGYSMVRSVRIAPLADERARMVQAVIDTEHYAFDPTPEAAGDAARTAQAGGPP